MQASPSPVGGIVILVAAAMILFGTVTRTWLHKSGDGGKMGMGLMGHYECGGDECEGKWFDTNDRGLDADLKATRYLGFFGGLATATMCVLCGLMALGKKRGPTVVVFILGAITAVMWIYFVVRWKHELRGFDPDIGYSFIVGIIGLIVGFVGAALSSGGARPVVQQPMMMQPMQPPMQMQQYPCPRCGTQLQFAAQYQRWFCPRCQQYV